MGSRADCNQEKKEFENRNYSVWKRGEKEWKRKEKVSKSPVICGTKSKGLTKYNVNHQRRQNGTEKNIHRNNDWNLMKNIIFQIQTHWLSSRFKKTQKLNIL